MLYDSYLHTHNPGFFAKLETIKLQVNIFHNN